MTLYRQVAAGHIDPAATCALTPDGRASGPTGISVIRDEVGMSLRDLAALMITASDNAAADAIFGRVGIGTVNATLAGLGLHGTHVGCGCADLSESMIVDAGVEDFGELWAGIADLAVRRRLRALDPPRTSRSTPRETARLHEMIWRDEVAPPAECAQMRRLLGPQVWQHRPASGLPFDDVKVSGKTGTLPTIRNEAGSWNIPTAGATRSRSSPGRRCRRPCSRGRTPSSAPQPVWPSKSSAGPEPWAPGRPGRPAGTRSASLRR